MKRWSVGVLVFDGVELLDFCGPIEAFAGANHTAAGEIFTVFTVAESSEPVKTQAGVRFLPDYVLADAPQIAILVVPGGPGTRPAAQRTELIAWIAEVGRQAELATSVCTGSFLIAQAGLLGPGSRSTTHWGSIERMRERFPEIDVAEQVRWVDNGAVITSAGVSAGIDMSLHVIERLAGTEVAASAARLMEYDYWQPASQPTIASHGD